MTRLPAAALPFLLIAAAAGCSGPPQQETPKPVKMEYKLSEVASSPRQWTGVAVGSRDRIFVTFPRWSKDVPVSLAELVKGQPVPYPNAAQNAWKPGGDAGTQFVCLQSALADDRGGLWVLDPANPSFEGIVEDGPKLVRFDLTLNRQVSVYRYVDPEVKPASYLNDFRLDLDHDVAYITDSGDGALIVTNLKNGANRRVLDDHPSTEAENVVITIDGKEWKPAGDEPPKVHADGIALSPDRKFLYYHALTGRTLYRVPTEALRDKTMSEEDLGAKVEKVAEIGPTDGMLFDPDGWLYFTALEENAIKRLDPDTGNVETVVQDPSIEWPDSLARDSKGHIYFTTSRIHLGSDETDPYRLFRIDSQPAGQ
ncbi:MAG TPA: L-dopachrome tautomerase-related protein [Candidatus Saccharimonadales bacterium]|nr:L-dopachrome tautomerase-related protein [Candidatus Saccharimonadales bacterium]